MSGVQNGGVGNIPQTVINNSEVRNRSISDPYNWALDMKELKRLYTEVLQTMFDGDCYAEDIRSLEDFIAYCLDKKVDLFPVNILPLKGIIDWRIYRQCIDIISLYLIKTGLMAEMISHCDVRLSEEGSDDKEGEYGTSALQP